jgi:hypothetical protein
MTHADLAAVADALVALFEITEPPVPVEMMMNNPRPGLWTHTDFSQLTFSFAIRGDRHAPRISMARMIVRLMIDTEFGRKYRLPELIGISPERITEMARLILVPDILLNHLPQSEHNAIAVAMTFMIPEDDAEARLGVE